MQPKKVIEAFDKFLTSKGESFSGIIIGGGALSLLGIISRETRDIDVLDPALSEKMIELAQEFAANNSLVKNWLNNEPKDLKHELPVGWMKRIVSLYSGESLELHTLGRSDLLKTKLFAYCDRDLDRKDCIDMKPTQEELREAQEWVKVRDEHPGWPKHVETSFQSLAKELGYASVFRDWRQADFEPDRHRHAP
jgi:hypothetical protein